MGFELGWSLVAESGVLAVSIVVGIDVGEELGARVVGVDEAPVLQHFGFQGSHEGFGPGVVIGVGSGRHALTYSGLAEDLPIGSTAVLAAAVAVEDWLLSGREPRACLRASATSWVRSLSARDQPMILREQRSMTTAR